jgi:hypothetical protein
MRTSNLIIVACLFAGCGGVTTSEMVVSDVCSGICKPTEMCTVDGQCLSGCLPKCGDRVCGGDPVCNISCGNCLDSETCNSGQCGAKVDPCNGTCKATELCTVNGECVSGCLPECGLRTCGPDPKCSVSCGDCAGTCTTNGQCDIPEENKLSGTSCDNFSCLYDIVGCSLSADNILNIKYNVTAKTTPTIDIKIKIIDVNQTAGRYIGGNEMLQNDTVKLLLQAHFANFTYKSHCTFDVFAGIDGHLKGSCTFVFVTLTQEHSLVTDFSCTVLSKP